MTKEREKGNVFLVIIFVIVVAWLFWFFFIDSNDDSNTDTCISSCLMDMDTCIWNSKILNSQGNGFVSWDNYDLCSLDLESCTEECLG